MCSEDLIVEARKFLFSDFAYGFEDTEEGDLIYRLLEALEAVEAERDVALASVERVKVILDKDDFGVDWEYDEWVYREAAEKKLGEIEAALDGAPEPEWEYQCTNSINTIGPLDDLGLHAKWCSGRIERRRKAGPWLPVEGESKP